ncbi:Os01g0602433 [Oryza sativa Japonica Group]|uniref:Os01g0602433 protein n=1 Tax=Oryza sativa subsp. japonica TaxID=39947 RepID=A0A0P0V4W9_ORYSJ|nr:hypothetical protein EE612_003914 [Oryza sativa]BAS73035.1 Os01g0602433 [Oryza sativa Japonica Group]
MWRMSVRWRKLKLQALKNQTQRHLGLKQREVLADADSRSPTEWEERTRILRCLRDPLREPLWFELMHVTSPDFQIMVDEQHGKINDDTSRVSDASYLHLLVCSPLKLDERWVQPKNLIEDHYTDNFEVVQAIVLRFVLPK